MPIHPINRHRYPKNWKQISLRIREEAGWHCEWCGAQNYKPHPDTGSRVVLTVAHLDHTPENNKRENLRALCQKCHLNYDRKRHISNRYRNQRLRQEAAGQLQLL